MKEGEVLIRLSNVSLSYDGELPVLDDVNFEIDRGDFVAVTGPNGGGKTTLLRVVLKLLKPQKGTVSYYSNGAAVSSLRTGYLPQKNNIDTRFPISVYEVVMSGLLQGFGLRYSAEDCKRCKEIMELMGVTHLADRTIGALSGGQLQRVLLGRALVSDPEILVLDEPLSYVDKSFEQQIYSIVEEVRKRTTILLVSHEMSIISGMANRHIIVDHGLHQCQALHHYIPSDCN